MSKNGPKTTLLRTSLTKYPQPPTKNFFQVQTISLAESFNGLNSSLAQSAEELKLLVLGRFPGTIYL